MRASSDPLGAFSFPHYSTMAEYDKTLSALYTELRSTSSMFKLERALMREFTSDVLDKHVIDMFCGEGSGSRSLKRRGAASVLGVDYSQNMIDIAVADEEKELTGTTFAQGDLAVPGLVFGVEADLVTAEFGLCYAKSVDELRIMLDNCTSSITKGGKMIATTSNPPQGAGWKERNELFSKKYGISYGNYSGVLYDADSTQVQFTLPNGERSTATNYWYSPDTYIRLLNKLGFDVEIYHPHTCPDEIADLEGELQDYLDNPVMFFIIATRR